MVPEKTFLYQAFMNTLLTLIESSVLQLKRLAQEKNVVFEPKYERTAYPLLP